MIKLLNVSLTSEATNDPGKTPSTNGLAYITVNGKTKEYTPQTKGFNVAVFDHLSGKIDNQRILQIEHRKTAFELQNDSGALMAGILPTAYPLGPFLKGRNNMLRNCRRLEYVFFTSGL